MFSHTHFTLPLERIVMLIRENSMTCACEYFHESTRGTLLDVYGMLTGIVSSAMS